MSRESLWAGSKPEDASHDWFAAPPRRPAPPQEPPPDPPRRPWWRRPALAGGLAGLLALVVAGAVLLLGGDDAIDTVDPLPASRGGISASRIGEIYARVEKGVVSVQVSEGVSGVASGTGFVIDDKDGTIVTNAHVIGEGRTARVRFEDGADPVRAKVIGTDPSSDLAVLRVDPSDVDEPLRALPLADSDEVQVGDVAVAVGYPLGLDRTATSGIISGLGREIRAPNGFRIDEVIQTDAPINPGNSGGPLLDGRGRVVGVNSQIATAGSRGNVGIGFAVPSNTVREVVPQLERGKSVRRPFLGVTTTPSTTGAPGAAIIQVSPGSPAERAGLEAGRNLTGSGGDVIVSIDGRQIITPDDVVDAVGSRRPGDKVGVVVERNGVTRRVNVVLGVRPSRIP